MFVTLSGWVKEYFSLTFACSLELFPVSFFGWLNLKKNHYNRPNDIKHGIEQKIFCHAFSVIFAFQIRILFCTFCYFNCRFLNSILSFILSRSSCGQSQNNSCSQKDTQPRYIHTKLRKYKTQCAWAQAHIHTHAHSWHMVEHATIYESKRVIQPNQRDFQKFQIFIRSRDIRMNFTLFAYKLLFSKWNCVWEQYIRIINVHL